MKDIKSLVCVIFLSIIIAGCAIAPIKESGRYVSNKGFKETSEEIVKLVNTCWTKPVRGWMGRDAIYGVPEFHNNELTITIGRDNIDISFTPFSTISIKKQNSGGVVVTVAQGDVYLGTMYDVDRSVREWLSGKHQCDPLEDYKVSK